MATDYYLADPDELATLTGKPAADERLLLELRNASRRFRGAVGHPVNLVVEDEVTLDGNGRTSLLLPVWPTVQVHSVHLDGALLDESGYQWSDAGVLRRSGCGRWPDRLRCVRVVYTHGWATIPEDIAEAVLDKAATMMRVPRGIASKAVGGQSVTYGVQAAIGVTDQWQKTVDRHRIRTAGDA
ncbi:mobile element protein [Streptomyces californicus]|uniref:mobile element protein n=1 Tax=Streptomyces californicus TaxID=67351 RepID=UPI00296F50C4|nr:mobile element protein [Streptomyces californicus]MDW4900663.1 mobile element protein [Streptomyces californicus]